MELKTSNKVLVSEARVYPTYDSKNSVKIVSGYYYIFNDTTRNGRIRITDSLERVNKPCQMTGWIDIDRIAVKMADEE